MRSEHQRSEARTPKPMITPPSGSRGSTSGFTAAAPRKSGIPCRNARNLALVWLVWRVVAWDAGAQMASSPAPSAPPDVVRLGVSQGMWSGVNANDAQAAIQGWTQTILKQRGNEARVETRIYTEVEALAAAFRRGAVDGASIQSERFLALEPELRSGNIFVALKQGSFSDRYVVLVHQASGLTNVAALRGRKIVVHQGARTGLAPCWLETLLADPAEGIREDTTRGLTRLDNASRTVLGVFFRQSDACVVTTNAFALACELNPQLPRQLRVLAVSPPIIPNLFFFRPDYTGTVKDSLESAITALHGTKAGQQILAVFQCDRMERQPASCLESTRQFLADYERLKRNGGLNDKRVPLVQMPSDDKP
jgi:ABC-type phosphate/phosphonate transport system substrate-binding protein